MKIPTTIVSAVAILTGLAIGLAIDRTFPSTDEVFAEPFTHEAALAETVRMRTASVTAQSVIFADRVVSYGQPYDTVGTWVLIELDVLPTGRPLVLTALSLESASGNTYGGTGDIPATCPTAQPGLTLTCEVAFEVADDDVPGLVLLVPASPLPDGAGDDLARIDLGIEPGWQGGPAHVDELDLRLGWFGARP